MKINVTYDGTAYPFDFADMTLPEAFTVKAVAHIDMGPFQQAVFDFNPHAVLALVVLALRRAGQPTAAKDVDQEKVDVQALAESLGAGIAAARQAAAAGGSARPA